MGIGDFIDQTKQKLGNFSDFISSTAQKVNPDKIGRFTTKLAQNAAVYVVQEGYKYLPGGVAVASIVSKTVHDMKADDQEGTIEKASNEDTNNMSADGKQAHNIAKEGLRNQPPSENCDGSKNHSQLTEETTATREELNDYTNSVKQKNNVSTDQCEGSLESMEKVSDESIKSSAPREEAGKKRVIIPSRL